MENSTGALPEPTQDATVEAAPSYFAQKSVEPPQALTPPEEKEEQQTNGPLKSLRKWFSKVPQNRKDSRSSPPTSRTSASSSGIHKWIAPKSPASPVGGIDGCRKHQGKSVVPTRCRRELTCVRDQRATKEDHIQPMYVN